MQGNLNNLALKTVTLGSYPVNVMTDRILHQFYFQKDTYTDAIKYAVKRQKEAGIDIISDGQVRGDIVSIVASCCHGINAGLRPQITGEIKRKRPIASKDMTLIRSLAKDTPIKLTISGPYTLAKNCSNTYYKNEEEVAWAFTDVLKDELKNASGIDMIQIDEPYLSVEYSHHAKEMIKELTKDMKVPTLLHVCGNITSIFADLLDYSVDILDHEFVAYPANIALLKEHSFKKIIGYGCVSVTERRIEAIKEIKDRIREALNILPKEQLIIDTDCGLRNLTDDLAFGKLRNMVHARDDILKELEIAPIANV